ncbi:MAG: hypothetical protein ABI165_10875 [Bryobacteraceae bacterium]
MLPREKWSAALEKEVGELKEYFQPIAEEKDRLAPEYLYHYTSFGNLCNILQSETIRLYDLLDMSDKQEFLHPLQIVYWTCPQF